MRNPKAGMRGSRSAFSAVTVLTLVACTKTQVTESEVPVSSEQRLVRKDPAAAPLSASFELRDSSILGKLESTSNCLSEEHRAVRQRVTTKTERDTTGNAIWLGAGAALLAGSAYVFVDRVPKASGAEACSANESGGSSCVSDKARMRALGTVLATFGVVTAAWGGVGLLADVEHEERDDGPTETRVQRGTTATPCFPARTLDGLVVKAVMPNGQIVEGVVENRRVVVAVPSGAGRGSVRLSVGSVPDAARDLLEEGTQLGSVELAP